MGQEEQGKGAEEFYGWDALLTKVFLQWAFALERMERKRFYVHGGYATMSDYLRDKFGDTDEVERNMRAVIRVAKMYEEIEVLDGKGEPTALGVLGIPKLNVLADRLSRTGIEDLVRTGRLIGRKGTLSLADMRRLKSAEELQAVIRAL